MRTLSQWIGAAIIGLYPKSRVAGVRVIFTDTDADRARCIAEISGAVDLLVNAGERYKALFRRIRYIVVWPGNWSFADSSGGVHIASGDLLSIGDWAVASVLVHEAVHLRVSDRGIKFSPAYRERIERLCIAEQARFLRLNPESGQEMAREVEALMDIPWWTPDVREAEMDVLFDENNVPRWLKTVVKRN